MMTTKKAYSKPTLHAERFQINKSISTTCMDPTISDLIDVLGLFNTDTETTCAMTPEEAGLGTGYEMACYHTIDVSFGSN